MHCRLKVNRGANFRALNKREYYLVIIRDNLCQFCTKIYVVIPHLNRLNGSDEGHNIRFQ